MLKSSYLEVSCFPGHMLIENLGRGRDVEAGANVEDWEVEEIEVAGAKLLLEELPNLMGAVVKVLGCEETEEGANCVIMGEDALHIQIPRFLPILSISSILLYFDLLQKKTQKKSSGVEPWRCGLFILIRA